MPEALVVDASAIVDLLLGNDLGLNVEFRLRGNQLHAPAHFDAEILSALGHLNRAGELTDDQVTERLDTMAAAAIERHPLPDLLLGAWARRHNLRLLDALYVELADLIGAPVVTTDTALAASTPTAELISVKT